MKCDLILTMSDLMTWKRFGYAVYISPNMEWAIKAKYLSSKLYRRKDWDIVSISDFNAGGYKNVRR